MITNGFVNRTIRAKDIKSDLDRSLNFDINNTTT